MSFDISKYPILALANTPEDLRLLPKESLPRLCEELRQYLLSCVSRSSGHLASGLGVVELTVALHYVYNTPFDQIVWDVGHQAYPHKILTGRREAMPTIRHKNGLHPFPWREESEYDVLSAGHSSTSISAGLGIAVAAAKEQLDRKTICVIGDGAITAGMAFEAMNHAGDIGANMLVILNDNEMSISENVGALNNHLAQLLSGQFYTRLRESGKKVLSTIPPIKDLVRKTEEHIKGIVSDDSSTMFESLGFNYIGPIDGHDLPGLIQTLKNIKQLEGPQLLHIMTKKGRGYAPAEKDPISWHGVSQFDPQTGTQLKGKQLYPSYSSVFGDWLCEMASHDDKLMAITPAMREGSGMVRFSKEFPEQYFDVAIAEQHAVTFAAGLAIGGYKPIVAIYSSFLQRAYDQVLHDVAIQNLPVLFAIDRAGIVGADGQTHQGAFDLSFLRSIPNFVVMTPSDENECRQMLYTGYTYGKGPTAVRYPRGCGVGAPLEPLEAMPIGKGVMRRHGKKIAFLNFGVLLPEVLKVADELDATVADMRFVKPLDGDMVERLAHDHEVIVTIEENAIQGGAGSAVNEYLMAQRCFIPVLNIGIPDEFIPQGGQNEMRSEYGLDAAGIMQQLNSWLSKPLVQ